MVKKYKKGLLIIFIFSLFFNFNNFIYAGKENVITPSGLSKSELRNKIETYVKEHKDTTADLAISVFNDKEELY